MKELLCAAFCNDLMVRAVPTGLAVTTPFSASDGDRIGFYVVQSGNQFRIEDDGIMFPTLEASGVDFRSGTRAEALSELQGEYGVSIDRDDKEFFIEGLSETEVPGAALKFVAFCLRVRDFMLMTEYRVGRGFRDDARKALAQVVGDRASIEENSNILDALADFPADFVLRAPGRPPVGVFLGISDERILQALFLWMRAHHEVRAECSIVALLESSHSVSARVRQQATNRLAAVAEFKGDETSAAQRVAQEALGRNHIFH